MAKYLELQSTELEVEKLGNSAGFRPVTLTVFDATPTTNAVKNPLTNNYVEGVDIVFAGATESTWMSKDDFNTLYKREITSDMPFSYALECLRQGFKVTRKNTQSWRTTVQRSILTGRGISPRFIGNEIPYDCPMYVRFKNIDKDPIPVMVVIQDGEKEQYPWNISITDILADDWELFIEEKAPAV
jgi:hypothetical protein